MTRLLARSRIMACAGAIAACALLVGVSGCSDDKDPVAVPTSPTFSIPTFSPPGLPVTSPIPVSDEPTRPTGPTGVSTRTTAATASKSPTPTAKKSDFDSGACLAGKIEETGREQDELTQVSCSDPSATFKIVRTFPYSIAGRPCDNVSGVDYSYDEYMTLNGVPTGAGTTYCLQEK